MCNSELAAWETLCPGRHRLVLAIEFTELTESRGGLARSVTANRRLLHVPLPFARQPILSSKRNPIPSRQESPRMTLHMYGRIDGTWVTLSDSRTSKFVGDKGCLEIVRENTIKYLTFPEDTTTWVPGDFAAVVMTFGRSDFAKPDGSGRIDDAISVIRSGLSTDGLPAITTAASLVDALWQPLKNRWYDCPACAQAHSDANNPTKTAVGAAPSHSDVDEYLGSERWPALPDECGHSSLSIVVVCVNSTDAVEILLREWGTPSEPHTASDRDFKCSDHRETSTPISGNFPADRDRILRQLGDQFDLVANEARTLQIGGCGDDQTAGPVGGTRSGWILCPNAGFTPIPVSLVNDGAPTKSLS